MVDLIDIGGRSEEVAMSAHAKELPQPSTLEINPTLDRVRGEFFEMRGFSPTVEQAARLFDLPRDECGRILGGLVQEGFLRRTSDGRYRLPA